MKRSAVSKSPAKLASLSHSLFETDCERISSNRKVIQAPSRIVAAALAIQDPAAHHCVNDHKTVAAVAVAKTRLYRLGVARSASATVRNAYTPVAAK